MMYLELYLEVYLELYSEFYSELYLKIYLEVYLKISDVFTKKTFKVVLLDHVFKETVYQ